MKVASPFRYPGAKSRMVKHLLPLIVPHVERAGSYCEPFVGGGSMALAVAAAVPGAHLWLNDADEDVSAFWQVIAGSEWADLVRIVRGTVPTVSMHHAVKSERGSCEPIQRAFRALFLNRTSFSGIIGAGPIGGLRQASRWGVGCRWNPARLCAQLEAVHNVLAGRTTVTRMDFRNVMTLNDASTYYLDPPYWEKGSMCYPTSMTKDDHGALAGILRQARHPWVLSYDAHPEVAKLYEFADVRTVDASYSMSGAGRQGWVDARELVIQPHTGAGS